MNKKIKELSSGQEFKNYKELCSFLNEEEKTGNAKKSQIKEWEQYFALEKQGQKITISEIYEKSKPKVDLRAEGNAQIYLKHAECTLLNSLARKSKRNDFQSIEMTTSEILLLSGFCNSNYIQDDYASILEINPEIKNFDINDFYKRVGFKLYKATETLVNNLKNRFILDVDKIYKITDEKGKRTATKKEKKKITDIKKKVLREMGLKDITEVYNKFKTKEFYERVSESLYDKYGWKDCYMVYELSFFKNELQNDIQIYQKELEEIENERKLLNTKIADSIDEQAVTLYDKNQQRHQQSIEDLVEAFETGNADKISDKKPFLLHSNYVINQKKLCEYLIKI